MKSHSSKAPSREAVLDAIRSAVKAAGGGRISLNRFLATSGMKSKDVYRNFPLWEEALKTAGCTASPYNAPVDPDALLADWGTIARDLKRLPTRKDYSKRGHYNTKTLENRFGSWTRVTRAFLTFVHERPEWADLQELVVEYPMPRRGRHLPEKPPGLPKSRWLTRRERARLKVNLPLLGVPLDFGVLRYAPTTETGVVLLFGSMAERLGYLIETVHPSFPDCKAARQAGPQMWESIRIE